MTAIPQVGRPFLGADRRRHVIGEIVGPCLVPLLDGMFQVRSDAGYTYTIRPADETGLDPALCEWVEVGAAPEAGPLPAVPVDQPSSSSSTRPAR